MRILSNPHITIATAADIPVITNLLNYAYRGEGSKQGWTTEADLIAGDIRTDENNLLNVMKLPGSVFLKYKGEKKQINGCVNLQKHGDKIYLGMFCVSPQLQGAGIGKEILKAAEEYAHHVQCMAIYMSVISVRKELIDWYKRHGYMETGERRPFAEDGLTGRHLKVLEFLVLEKPMNGSQVS